MVNMTDGMRIVQMHLMEKSTRGIAAKLRPNRKTIDRCVSRYEAAQPQSWPMGPCLAPLPARRYFPIAIGTSSESAVIA